MTSSAQDWFCAQESFLMVLGGPDVLVEIEPGLVMCMLKTLNPCPGLEFTTKCRFDYWCLSRLQF